MVLQIKLNFETIFIPGKNPTWPQYIILFICGSMQFANILKTLFHDEYFFFFVVYFPVMFLSHLGIPSPSLQVPTAQMRDDKFYFQMYRGCLDNDFRLRIHSQEPLLGSVWPCCLSFTSSQWCFSVQMISSSISYKVHVAKMQLLCCSFCSLSIIS